MRLLRDVQTSSKPQNSTRTPASGRKGEDRILIDRQTGIHSVGFAGVTKILFVPCLPEKRRNL